MEQKERVGIEYFDQGRGTPYERISLWDFFEDLVSKADSPKSFLEIPRDGMFGINGVNSLYLASRGRKVSIFFDSGAARTLFEKVAKRYHLVARAEDFKGIDSLRKIPERSYDFVWAFNVLSDFENYDDLLREMARISSKYVFFTYMNKMNYGYFIHRLHHKCRGESWDHTDLKKTDLKRIDSFMEKDGFVLERLKMLDVPWWPDIGAPMGEVVRDIFFRGGAKKEMEQAGLKWDDLPYFNREKFLKFRNGFTKDFAIERHFPGFIKVFFAHHFGVLYRRRYK